MFTCLIKGICLFRDVSSLIVSKENIYFPKANKYYQKKGVNMFTEDEVRSYAKYLIKRETHKRCMNVKEISKKLEFIISIYPFI